MANKTVINAAKAKEMTEDYMTDLLAEAGMNGPHLFEINAQDPEGGINTEGVFLEVVILDDVEAAVRDRWPSIDNDRTVVPIADVYAIYHALVDQVADLLSEEGN